jgi:hypothetical protein
MRLHDDGPHRIDPTPLLHELERLQAALEDGGPALRAPLRALAHRLRERFDREDAVLLPILAAARDAGSGEGCEGCDPRGPLEALADLDGELRGLAAGLRAVVGRSPGRGGAAGQPLLAWLGALDDFLDREAVWFQAVRVSTGRAAPRGSRGAAASPCEAEPETPWPARLLHAGLRLPSE